MMSHDVGTRYKKEGDAYLIEVKIKRIGQLFTSFDPSPFFEKDLDEDAVDYIVSSVKEFPRDQKLKLIIHVWASEKKRIAEKAVKEAIHNYFHYTSANSERKLRNKLKDGRYALLVGIIAMAVGLSSAELIQKALSGVFKEVVVEGLIIGGWAAMWFPITLFLYEWWPLAREIRLFKKIANMEVDIRYYE